MNENHTWNADFESLRPWRCWQEMLRIRPYVVTTVGFRTQLLQRLAYRGFWVAQGIQRYCQVHDCLQG
jgi:hypothetical protein